jgi:hypothetical protein
VRVLLAALLVFGFLYRMCIKTALKYALAGRKSEFMTFSLLKIGMAFLFQTSLLSRFQLDWGALMRFIFQLNSVTGSGDATKLASAECFGLGLHNKTTLMFAAPFIVLLLPLPMLLKALLRVRFRAATVFGVPPRDAYWAAVLVGWWLLHPAVLAHCVVTLMTLPVGGKEYALADLSIETSDPAYATTRALATALLYTFVPAVPLYIFGTLYRWRRQLREGKQGGIPQGVRFRLFYVFGSYAPAQFYWEGVVFAVRTAMVLLTALSSTFVGPGLLRMSVFATRWVTLLHFRGGCQSRPYARDVENWINNVTQGALLALLLGALGLSLDDAKQENRGFENILRTCCAALLIGTMGILASAFTRQCVHKRAAQKQKKKAASSASSDPQSEQTDVRRSGQAQVGALTDEQAASVEPSVDDAFPATRPSRFEFDNPLHGTRDQTNRDSVLAATGQRISELV